MVTRRRFLVLGVCCMSLFIVSMDTTIDQLWDVPVAARTAGTPARVIEFLASLAL
jgi:hypothetical protein